MSFNIKKNSPYDIINQYWNVLSLFITKRTHAFLRNFDVVHIQRNIIEKLIFWQHEEPIIKVLEN